MRLVDTHAHLNDERYKNDLQSVIQRANAAGVERIVVCGFDLASSELAIRIASNYEIVFATVGVHPHDAAHYNAGVQCRLSELSRSGKVIAIGEIGLDFHYDFSPRKQQLAAYEAQVSLAAELGLPMVVHSRESNTEALQVLKDFAGNIVGCVFHCFSGDERFARDVLDMGFYIGVDGPITYKTSEKLRKVVEMCPLDRVLIETDSPYLTPVPHRGKRNEPAYVRYVAEAVAAVKRRPVEEVTEITAQNASNLFGDLYRGG